MYTRSTHIPPTLLLLVLCLTPSFCLFIPKILECGTAQDVVSVPQSAYPVSISAARDSLSSTVVTWQGPYPALNSTLVFQGSIISYIVHEHTKFHETNRTSKQTFASFTLSEVTWEASRTTTSECEGFYLGTNLTNGGHIEINWYVYKTDDMSAVGGIDIPVHKGYPKFNVYISDYPYMHPGESTPTLQIYSRFPGSLARIPPWNATLGTSPSRIPNPVQNTTFIGGYVPALGSKDGILGNYHIDDVGVLYRWINFGVLNDNHTTIFLNSEPDEVTGAGVLSVAVNETQIAHFTGTDDVLYIDPTLIAFSLNATYLGGADGTDSGADNLNSSLFPLLLSYFLQLF